MGRWLAGATCLGSFNGYDGLSELRAGEEAELDLGQLEGVGVALAAAGLLEPCSETLTGVSFR